MEASAHTNSNTNTLAFHHHHQQHQHHRRRSGSFALSAHLHPDLLVAGLPIVAGILVATTLVLVVTCYKRRHEPHIPDLSDPRSDELNSSPFPASNLTKELYLPNSNTNSNTNANSNLGPTSSSSFSSFSSSSTVGWFSIEDDLYKNYSYFDKCAIRGVESVSGSGFPEVAAPSSACTASLCNEYRPPPPCCEDCDCCCVNHLNHSHHINRSQL